MRRKTCKFVLVYLILGLSGCSMQRDTMVQTTFRFGWRDNIFYNFKACVAFVNSSFGWVNASMKTIYYRVWLALRICPIRNANWKTRRCYIHSMYFMEGFATLRHDWDNKH